MPLRFFLIGFAMTLLLGGCGENSNLDAPRKFFAKNKIGSSPDYAVIKWNNPEDHAVTVHGFMDDLKSCRIIADALNKDACSETGGQGCLNPFSTTKQITANRSFQRTIKKLRFLPIR